MDKSGLQGEGLRPPEGLLWSVGLTHMFIMVQTMGY